MDSLLAKLSLESASENFPICQGRCLTHYITHCLQFGEEGKMAAGNTGFCYEDIPVISPITTKYMIINWVNIVQDVDGIVMKNFDVSRCYYWEDNKTVYLNDHPWELKFTDKDSAIFGPVVKNAKYRVWFKCISNVRMICTDKIIGEEGEIEEKLGQSGYIAIRMKNDKEKIKICTDYYEHMDYNVVIQDSWPWGGCLSYDPDKC